MRPDSRSAGHVQDGVCFLRVLAQLLNRLDCRQHQQLDMAALGFLFHFVHHRQSACSGADDQPSTFPRDLFLHRKWRVAEIVPKFLGGLLLTLADLPTIDEHVVFVSDPVDTDRTKRERLKADRFHCLHCFHVASLNRLCGKLCTESLANLLRIGYDLAAGCVSVLVMQSSQKAGHTLPCRKNCREKKWLPPSVRSFDIGYKEPIPLPYHPR